jgi:curli biogenesis system outer membrane secretion channel CsgG
MILHDVSLRLAACATAAFLLISAQSVAAPARGGLRFTVMVDKFENKTGNGQLGDEWATMLTAALHEDGHFIVVAEDDMQLKALKEQLRGLSGVTAQGRKTAARGQMSPAQLLVKGVITHVQQGTASQGGGFGVGKIRIAAGRKSTEVRATLQMIDTTTGAVVAAKNFTGVTQGRAFSIGGQEGNSAGTVNMGQDDNLHDAFEKAIAEVIPWMVSQLPSVSWRGSVVRVADGRIIINRGSREGVTVGDEFLAGESEILRDPDTGEFLDEVIHERARIRVERLTDRTSICSVVGGGDVRQIVTGMAIQYRSEGN